MSREEYFETYEDYRDWVTEHCTDNLGPAPYPYYDDYLLEEELGELVDDELTKRKKNAIAGALF